MLTEQEQKILDNAPNGAEWYCAGGGIYCTAYLNADKSKIYPMQASGWEWKDICSTDINRFDKLSDLRKKQCKTVVDAVNHYEGDLGLCIDAYVIYKNEKFSVVDFGDWMEFKVCGLEEFNQCVKELSEYANRVVHGDLWDYEQYKKDYQEPIKPDVVIGSTVTISNDEGYGIWAESELFIGEKCTVLAKFKSLGIENEERIPMVVVGLDGGASCCFREDMCATYITPKQNQLSELLVTYQEHADKDVLAVLFEMMQRNGDLEEV